MKQLTQRQLIIIGVGFFLLLCGVLIGIFAYTSFVFKVVSVDPEEKKFATDTSLVTMTLSHDIDTIEQVKLTPGDTIEPIIEGRTIKLDVSNLFTEGQQYTLQLNNIRSKNGQVISRYSYTFTPQYVAFNEQSESQQKIATDRSNSQQVDDPFLNNIFPIVRDTYLINVSKDQDSQDVYVRITILAEVPDYDNGGVISQVSNEEAELIRTQALETIKEYDGSPDKYLISYSNIYLNETYSTLIQEEDFHEGEEGHTD